MTPRTRDDLWRELCEAGLAQGELPARSDPGSPWFVRAMLGVAGWIGALFLLGFVGAGLAFVFRNEAVSLGVGLLCCGAAYMIFARAGSSVLATQFGLAVSLAGQVMVIIGLHEGSGLNEDSPLLFLLIAGFEAALAWFLDSFVHRVWSTLAAGIALGYALNLLGLYGFGTVIVGVALTTVWLDEDSRAARGAFWRAVGYGLAFALVQPASYVGGWFFWRNPVPPLFGGATIWIRAVLLAGVLVYLVYRILQRYETAPSSRVGSAALAAATIVGAVTLRAPGVTSGLIIVLLGFAGGNRVLFGFGILSVLSYLSYFYYSLQMTLLMKSLVLAGSGVALIFLWLVMRLMFRDAGQEHGRA
jgi:hypothetical protein